MFSTGKVPSGPSQLVIYNAIKDALRKEDKKSLSINEILALNSVKELKIDRGTVLSLLYKMARAGYLKRL